MPNPLNPLDWLKSAQDWFTKTERSSGFRPYLIFLMLLYGFSAVLLALFANAPGVRAAIVWLIVVASGGFILLFSIKAFHHPDFCRSETHIQKMMKLEIEKLGTETEVLDAEIVEAELLRDAVPDPASRRLTDGSQEGA